MSITLAQRAEQLTSQSLLDLLAAGNLETDNRDKIRYVPEGTGPAWWGPGDQLTFLITARETGGAFSLMEAVVPPGGGPPPHIHHREDETFYVLEGCATVTVGGKTLYALPGDLVFLPRGVEHCFKNTGTENAKFLCLITPGGFEGFFAESFFPATDRKSVPPPISPELIARMNAAAPRYGLEFVPPRSE
jgi:mannose-6-phosphate isomerase-like protein (cupin superfamily)